MSTLRPPRRRSTQPPGPGGGTAFPGRGVLPGPTPRDPVGSVPGTTGIGAQQPSASPFGFGGFGPGLPGGGFPSFPNFPTPGGPGDGGGAIDFVRDVIDLGRDVRDLISPRRRELAGGGAGRSGTSCPEGFQVDAEGRCVEAGAGGLVRRTLPGGDPGMLTADFGPAVMGAFGKPALVPAQVGTIQRQDGSVGPVLRCPAGMVLGKDDLCYPKSSISRSDRKWAPAPKPPMSAADAKALRRIGTLQGKVKRLAKTANMTCKKK